MSFPRQDSVMARLTAQSLRELNKLSDVHLEALNTLLRQAQRELRADIVAAYAAVAPHGGPWDLTALQASGTLHRLSARAAAVLNGLRQRAGLKAAVALRDLKSEGARRQRWALSQVVPPSRHFRLRLGRGEQREADVPLLSGFAERWDQWVAGYHEALVRNLRMGALNQSSVTDAAAEVLATRVGTPAYTLEAALDRLWGYYAWEAITGGMHQPVGEVGDDVEEEIWRTSGDLRVCDDCDENEGETREDADGTIPLHPNCNCFYQVVPTSYAALLRSGSEEDRDLARQMDVDGVAPNAIVIRGPDGDVKGRAIVDFGDWEEAQGMAVKGGA